MIKTFPNKCDLAIGALKEFLKNRIFGEITEEEAEDIENAIRILKLTKVDMERFSQNNEEQYILDHFGDFKGRFLDVGAFDGKNLSNTWALAQSGWSGVCIEPSPYAFTGLMQNYKGRDDIKLVNAAISYKDTGLIDFADSLGDAVSTTSAAHEEIWNKARTFQHIYVNTITIREVMRIFGDHYDFISLDVEGTNIEILRTLPLELMTPSLICIEHEHRFDEILSWCAGYTEIHRNGENIILKKNV